MFGRVPLRTGGAVRRLTAHRVPTGRLMVYRLRADCRAQGQSRKGFVQKGIFGGHRTLVADARRGRVFRPAPSGDAAGRPVRAANSVVPAQELGPPEARSELRAPTSGSAPQASVPHLYEDERLMRFHA